jgi:hypothetical protein
MSTSLKGKAVHFDDQYLHVELADRRIISTPMDWYPELQQASLRQLRTYRFICRGTGIEWPELDFHLSLEGMLAARDLRRAA